MSRAHLSTGHVSSPYLRRFRLPALGTYRGYEDPLSPSDELAKLDLITARMSEMVCNDNQGNPNNNIQKIQEDTSHRLESISVLESIFHPRKLFAK